MNEESLAEAVAVLLPFAIMAGVVSLLLIPFDVRLTKRMLRLTTALVVALTGIKFLFERNGIDPVAIGNGLILILGAGFVIESFMGRVRRTG